MFVSAMGTALAATRTVVDGVIPSKFPVTVVVPAPASAVTNPGAAWPWF